MQTFIPSLRNIATFGSIEDPTQPIGQSAMRNKPSFLRLLSSDCTHCPIVPLQGAAVYLNFFFGVSVGPLYDSPLLLPGYFVVGDAIQDRARNRPVLKTSNV